MKVPVLSYCFYLIENSVLLFIAQAQSLSINEAIVPVQTVNFSFVNVANADFTGLGLKWAFQTC